MSPAVVDMRSHRSTVALDPAHPVRVTVHAGREWPATRVAVSRYSDVEDPEALYIMVEGPEFGTARGPQRSRPRLCAAFHLYTDDPHTLVSFERGHAPDALRHLALAYAPARFDAAESTAPAKRRPTWSRLESYSHHVGLVLSEDDDLRVPDGDGGSYPATYLWMTRTAERPEVVQVDAGGEIPDPDPDETTPVEVLTSYEFGPGLPMSSPLLVAVRFLAISHQPDPIPPAFLTTTSDQGEQ